MLDFVSSIVWHHEDTWEEIDVGQLLQMWKPPTRRCCYDLGDVAVLGIIKEQKTRSLSLASIQASTRYVRSVSVRCGLNLLAASNRCKVSS